MTSGLEPGGGGGSSSVEGGEEERNEGGRKMCMSGGIRSHEAWLRVAGEDLVNKALSCS